MTAGAMDGGAMAGGPMAGAALAGAAMGSAAMDGAGLSSAAMSGGCELVQATHVGGPMRMPLRMCCVTALIERRGDEAERFCPRVMEELVPEPEVAAS